MYLPPAFKEDRLPVLHDLIREHPFATLVTLREEGFVADHLPLMLEEPAGSPAMLRGHVARSNPLWKAYRPGSEALAVFHGPNTYISPAHYPTKLETGKVVPTWNYAVVHAYGPLRFVEEAGWLCDFVQRLTEQHESGRPNPWRVSDAPDDYIAGMLKAIVGVELPIARIEGKWKMSQNRTPQDRAGVIAGLRDENESGQRAVAALVFEADLRLRE
jgi:transcriptional regulator